MMNKKNLQQIFANYIDRFAELNDAAHDETFKWWAAAEFRKRMDEALQSDNENFVAVLRNIVKNDVVGTIIDGRMQPFGGLVAIAGDNNCKLAGDVKQLFLDLFANDGNDLEVREKKIAAFLKRSEELRLATKYSKYYSYKQTARSVSGYLFLYDPDNHYMYKATQAKLFSDCMEFYGDWGSGDEIKLKEYYKMCDELVAEIKECSALLATDQSRFHENFKYSKDDLHQDTQKHILAYDIIYCSTVYNLFEGITFKPITAKEKKLYEERLKKAQELQEKYTRAESDYQELKQAMNHYDAILVPDAKVQHFCYGTGKIISRKDSIITVQFVGKAEHVKFDYYGVVGNRYLKFDDSLDEETAKVYRKLFKCHSDICETIPRLEKALKEYEDILE